MNKKENDNNIKLMKKKSIQEESKPILQKSQANGVQQLKNPSRY